MAELCSNAGRNERLPLLDTVTQPKLFISYAHADGESTVKDFWTTLHEYLKTPDREWDKWDDKEILVGQEWDNTIIQALERGCNCCLLLVSDLFAKSSYIINKEWPKTLARNEEQGMVFFPVVFGVLEGGLAALPETMRHFQVYWPTVAELYVPPPANISNPNQMRQCYKDAKEKDAVRDRFLSRLASQMNVRFDEYLREQAIRARPTFTANPQVNTGQFVTNTSDEETFARAIFGSFSYEKRYRDSNSKDHYFPRLIDGKLDERLQRNEWVLVEGHPLAGKTRAVFEAIKRLMLIGRSVAVWPFKTPDRTDQPLIPPAFPEADCCIVWIDDIDTRFRDLAKQGYSTNEINRFLERIADAGVILAATTRTGPAYYDFRHRFGLDDHLWDKLESSPIHRLEGEEDKEFRAWYGANFGASLPDKFDHHPGSLFLNLETMGDRWRNMDKIIGEHKLKLDVERAKDIMRALHVFYVMEAYRAGGLFLEEDIRFYLRHKAEKRQTTTSMGIAFAKEQLFYQHSSGEEWETLIEFLSQDKFHLGFLRREGESLLTETAYLDYIVAPDGEKNIAQTIVEYFAKEERLKLGLMVTSYNFGEVFRTNPPKNEKDLVKLVRKLKPLGLEREITIWNQLLYLCPTLPLARLAVELLRSVGLTPDVITYHALFDKARDDATARAVIAEMQAAGITPSVGTYNRLVGKSQDYETARTVIAEMQAAGISPNIITYTTLIAKVQDYETARAVIAEMQAAGIQPDLNIYNRLVAKARDDITARAAIAEMQAAGITPNVGTYNRLVGKSQDDTTARAVIAEMQAAGIQPNVGTYNKMVERAQDDATARAIIAEMQVAGIQPDIITYTTLFDKVYDDTTARAVIAEMQAAGISPNIITYTTLIAKVQDYETARAVIAEMQAAGIQPDGPTLSALFAKDLSLVNVDDLLDWYLNESYQLESPMEAAIKSYHQAGQINCALAIALYYPHLEATHRLIRENQESALTYFRSVVALDPAHENGNYALGIALIETNRDLEATPYLEKAYTQASIRDQSSLQVKYIEQLLRRILDGTPG